MYTRIYAWLGVLALSPCVALANSQTATDKLVVSATKRDQLWSQVDAGISVVSGDELNKAGITQIGELERVFPGLVIRTRGNRAYAGITLRGQSSPNFYSPTVQVFVDGVPQDMAFLTQPLVNVERVELLRGPQGTLYGGNAYGGVINIVTRGVGEEPQGRLSATLADQQRLLDLSAASAKSAQGGYADVSLRWEEEPGVLDDVGSGQSDIDEGHSYAGQVRFGWKPEDSPLSLVLSLGRDVVHSHEETYVRDSLLSAKQYNSSTQGAKGALEREVNSYALNVGYDFGAAQLTSITALQERDMARALVGRHFPETQDNLSQEFRFAFGGVKHDSVVGLFWQTQDFTRRDPGFSPFFGPSLNAVEKRSLAVFGESTIYLTETLDLTAGLRWSQDKASIDFARTGTGAFNFNRSDTSTNISPKLALGWTQGDNGRFYLSATQGYQPGGFNHTVASPNDAIAFDPERSLNLETGWRGHLLDQSLQLNSALYWISSKDKQLYVGPLGAQVLRNVGDGRSYGVEVEARWHASDDLSLTFGANIGRSELRNTASANAGVNYDGNRLPYAPDEQLQLGVDYRIPQSSLPGDLHFSLHGRYYSDIYFNEANSLKQGSYSLFDTSLALNLHNGLRLSVFAENLTDEVYRTSSFAFGPGDVRSILGDGRILGVTASIDF